MLNILKRQAEYDKIKEHREKYLAQIQSYNIAQKQQMVSKLKAKGIDVTEIEKVLYGKDNNK